jgi:hypothetical protein
MSIVNACSCQLLEKLRRLDIAAVCHKKPCCGARIAYTEPHDIAAELLHIFQCRAQQLNVPVAELINDLFISLDDIDFDQDDQDDTSCEDEDDSYQSNDDYSESNDQ